MQVIENNLFTILLPEVGYKLLNKTNNKQSSKVYLGLNDSIDNYIEVVDDEYIDVKYKIELGECKTELNNIHNTNELNLDMLLLSISKIYEMFEPILAMIPVTMNITDFDENETNPLVTMYVCMIKRGLITIEKVPQNFRDDVMELI